jgi:alpha-tubulin suppressor-like RCC1 family protein
VLFLTTTGQIYGVGHNQNGEILSGDTNLLTSPRLFSSSFFFSRLFTGTNHVFYLTRDEIMYCSGLNTSGQLGLQDLNSRGSLVSNTQAIKYTDISAYKVASGYYHTIFINNSGLTYAFGTNTNGQLGFGNTITLFVPTVIPVLKDINICQIACGAFHSFFIESNGRVYACGSYLNGRLGISGLTQDVLVPTNIPAFNSIKIVQVVAGSSHSLFLASTGRVYACGSYLNGRLGTGSVADVLTPIEITYFSTNSIFITQISAGDSHSMFLDTNGVVYACGSFSNGRLGTSSITDVLTPISLTYFITIYPLKIKQVSCGSDYTMLLTVTGNVYVCGSFTNGKLGTGSLADEPLPILLSTLSSVRTIIAGYNHTLFLTRLGVYATGLNANGQLGINTIINQNIPVLITSVINVKNIIGASCGFSFSVFITNETTPIIYSCGSTTTTKVPLSISYLSKATNTEIVSASTGTSHTILIDNIGNAYVFGNGANYQLGTDSTTSFTTPMILTLFRNANIKFASVSCGDNATMFVTTTGEVYSCGYEVFASMLGAGGDIRLPRNIANYKLTYFTTNSIFIVKAILGNSHSLLLSNVGRVYAFGRDANAMGAAITPSTSNIASTTPSIVTTLNSLVIKDISTNWQHSLFLTNTGLVYSTGANANGQLGLADLTARSVPTIIPFLTDVKQASAGYFHSVFLLNDGTVYSCGLNSSGQLGLGDTTDRNIPVIVSALEGITIVKISATGYNTRFLSDTGFIYICGLNIYGQLGLRDYTNRIVPTISYLVTENFSEDFFSGGTLLPDGRVLFTPNNSDKLGIFNPTTNAFSYDISTKATSFANNYQGSSLLPDGRIIYAPNNDNTVGMLSGLSAVPLERCIHPTFNNF